jgi:hypothetical protein
MFGELFDQRRTIAVCGASSLLLIGSVVLSLGSGADTRSSVSIKTNRQQSVQAQPGNPNKPMIRVFVHNEDIYPDVIRTRPGTVRIRAENETLSDISLVIERITPGQSNQRLANIRTMHQAKRDEQESVLGVGEYFYYDEARPEIKGRLIVEPQ